MKKTFILALAMLLTTIMAKAQSKTEVIAHRGHWKAEGSAQNSRTSLKKALEMGIYGSEIDIWLTTDNKQMVNHDDDYDGVVIREATSKQCKALILKNGEHMPMLKDMLKLLKKSKTRTKLIIEVKPLGNKQRDQESATRAMRMVRKYHLEKKVDYISFSIEACKTLARLDPTANVAFLDGNMTPTALHEFGINGIDYHYSHFQKHPEWVKEAHDLGMTVNAWTVDKRETMDELITLGLDFITTNEPERCTEACKK